MSTHNSLYFGSGEQAPLISGSSFSGSINSGPALSISPIDDVASRRSSIPPAEIRYQQQAPVDQVTYLDPNPSQKVVQRPVKKRRLEFKDYVFILIAFITLLYCFGELGVAVWQNESLTLLSDGFHNLSDVLSLGIAFWASMAAKRGASDTMSFGWGRAEIIGAFANGCSLIALCIFIALEAIPRFINPADNPQPHSTAGIVFMATAGAGLVVNTFGTIMLALVGAGHHHHPGHSHDHGHDHGHGHDHSHGHKHDHDEHEHKHDKKKKHKHDKEHKHKHDHHDEETGLAAHDHHAHSHGHDHDKKKKKKKEHSHYDMNTWAVLIHYAGDAVSSLFVLGAGAALYFLPERFHKYTQYIDPAASLIIVALILWSTIPFVKHCANILLQSTPTDIDLKVVRKKLGKIEGIISIHDLHVWVLVDGMSIGSVHLAVAADSDFSTISKKVKKVFHKFGIHSSTIQPEYLVPNSTAAGCASNCAEGCDENWCCKTEALALPLNSLSAPSNLNQQHHHSHAGHSH